MTGRGLRYAVLAAALFLAGGAVPADRAQAQLSLSHLPLPATYYFHADQLITVYVRAQTPQPLQAYDIGVVYDPAVLKAVVVQDLGFFDGNTDLLLTPSVDAGAGVVSRIVDARLGAPTGTGDVFLVGIVYRVLQPGVTTLDFNAFAGNQGFADAAGAALAGVTVPTPITIEANIDSDFDGLPDAYELQVTLTDPNDPDTDNDGTLDGSEDPDGDGIPSVAEYLQGSSAAVRDTDTDGFPDGADTCPQTYNPLQVDSDGDGAGDACDPDGDNDALDDVDEPALGLDPGNPDTDGDTFLDGVEVSLGTDPTDPASFPAAAPTIGATGSAIFILLILIAGAYRIRRTPRTA